MTTNEFNRSLERDRSLLVFRNNRLLVGLRTAGAITSEAWLGETSQEGVIRDHATEDRTDTLRNGLRVYTSSDGLEEIMDLMEFRAAHPAVLYSRADHGAVSSSELRLVERLKLVARRLGLPQAGQVAYHEREGGELEAREGTEEMRPTGSGSSSSERSAQQPTTCNDDADQTLGSDFEIVGRDASPSGQSAHQSTTKKDDVYETFGSDFERMGRDTSPSEETTQSAQYEEGVEPMERYTLSQCAALIRSEVILQATASAKPALICNIHLGSYLPALTLAESIYDIVQLSREVLVRLDAYRAELGKEFDSQVRILEDAEAKKMSESILARHMETVMEYKRYECDTRTVYMNLKIQIEDIETRRVLERYGAISPLDRFMDEQ
jgi:hypothetical protein